MELKVQDFHPQPSVVFLHGWGVNNGVFDGLLPHITHDYSVRFLDLPGFGSNADVDISSLDFNAYCELVRQNIPDDASVIGWSLGGLVAQQLAIADPKKIKSLMLICTSPWFMDEEESEGGWRGIKPRVLENFQVQLKGDFAKTLERFLAIQSLGSETAKSDLKTIKNQVFKHPQPGAVALKKGLEYLQTVDLRSQMRAIDCPVLRIFGSQDSLVPKAAIDMIREIHPEAEYKVVRKASHAPFISHTDEFMAIFRAFL